LGFTDHFECLLEHNWTCAIWPHLSRSWQNILKLYPNNILVES